ncbi:MAG: hypothetical protein AAFN70_20270, partial [Planctomycetota bacterium]
MDSLNPSRHSRSLRYRQLMWFLATLLALLPVLCIPIRGISLPGITIAQAYLGLTVLGMIVVSLIDSVLFGVLERKTILLATFAGLLLSVPVLSALRLDVSLSGGGFESTDAIMPLLQIALAIGWIAFVARCNWQSDNVWRTMLILALPIYAMQCLLWLTSGLSTPFVGLGYDKNEIGSAAVVTFLMGLAAIQGLPPPKRS